MIRLYEKEMRWPLLLFVFILSLNNMCKGQTPFNLDPNWVKNNAASDDFNYGIPPAASKPSQLASLQTKWRILLPWGTYIPYNSTPGSCNIILNDDGTNINFSSWANPNISGYPNNNDGLIQLIADH